MRVVGVILAGGRGERLGGRLKANVEIGGRRLLDRVAQVMADLEMILVAHGRHDASDFATYPPMIPIADLPGDYGGPLAGLAAAVDWANRQSQPPSHLLLAAVDAPFLPAHYVPSLVAALNDAPALVVHCQGQAYPTNSLWQLPTISGLADGVRAGTAPRSLRRLAEALAARQLDWPIVDGFDPFANINTPDDLARAEAFALRHDASDTAHN